MVDANRYRLHSASYRAVAVPTAIRLPAADEGSPAPAPNAASAWRLSSVHLSDLARAASSVALGPAAAGWHATAANRTSDARVHRMGAILALRCPTRFRSLYLGRRWSCEQIAKHIIHRKGLQRDWLVRWCWLSPWPLLISCFHCLLVYPAQACGHSSVCMTVSCGRRKTAQFPPARCHRASLMMCP